MSTLGIADEKNQAGYSLLWVMMLVAMLGVSLMIGEEIYRTSVRRDHERELIFIGRQMREAIARYYEATPGAIKQYPDSLEALLLDPRVPGSRRYLRKIYLDPMTGKSEWGLYMLAGKVVGVHSLSAERPIKVAKFEPTEASFEGREKYSDWVFCHPPDLLLKNTPSEMVPNISTPRAEPAGIPSKP